MIKEFILRAKNDEPVYITEVETAFRALDKKTRVVFRTEMVAHGEFRDLEIFLPNSFEDTAFMEDYFFGKIYNIISTLGGKNLTVFYDAQNSAVNKLVKKLDKVFCIDEPKSARSFYGRSINVADRINEALYGGSFTTAFAHIENYAPMTEQNDAKVQPSTYAETVDQASCLVCGIDVGGTDIKMALSEGNQMICFKEYDWYPASYPKMDEIISPIKTLVKLMRVKVTCERLGGNEMMKKQLEIALDKHAKLDEITTCVQFGESLYKDKLLKVDRIGMSFPDVVVQNKIVGGEVSKVKSVRENADVDFEREFGKLRDLDIALKTQCNASGGVAITNDGPMAAFTAAVELAYGEGKDRVNDGVFAHTLGTELGTGWVNESGIIPEIPLEAYNYVVDLGSYAGREFECNDLRSTNNFNTHIPGTVQKYTSQYGVFRLAIKHFKKGRPDLYIEMFEKGFIMERNGGLYVPTEPADLRKPFLEFLMALPEREDCPVCRRIFEEIGEYLAIVWKETEQILNPRAKERVLFGRLVKNKTCFALMQAGAKRIAPELTLSVANESLANTLLMQQLKAHPEYTVAQFAQAVGAIYFAMRAK